MKLTHNALSMLLKAYRAIFKSAYIKGVASAVVLTAGLTTAASAADLKVGTADEPADSIIVNEATTLVGGYVKDLTVNNALTKDSGTLTDHLRVLGTMTMNKGSSLVIKGTSSGIVGVTQANEASGEWTGDLVATGATIELAKSQIQMANISLTDTKVTLGTNIGDNTSSDWADNTMLTAVANEKDGVKTDGVLTIAGASTVEMQKGSVLNGLTVNLNGGQVNMAGNSGDGTLAVIRAFGADQGTININGAKIAVSDNGNYIAGHNINLNNASSAITVAKDAELKIGGAINNQKNIASGTDWTDSAVVTASAGTISNAGTLTVKGSITATGAVIDNSGTLTLTGDAKLGSALKNTGKVQASGALTVEKISTLAAVSDEADAASVQISKLSDGVSLTVTGEDTFDLSNSKFKLTLSGSDGSGSIVADKSTVTVADGSANNYDSIRANAIVGAKGSDNGIFTIADNKTITALTDFSMPSADTDASNKQNVKVSGSFILGDADAASAQGSFHGINAEVTGGTMTFAGGQWADVGEVTVSTGTMAVQENAAVTVSKLTAGQNGVDVTGGSLTAKDISLTSGSAVSVTDAGTFSTAAANVMTFKAAEDKTPASATLVTSKYAEASAVDLDTVSTLQLTGAKDVIKADSINGDAFQAIKEAILGENAVGILSFDDVSVTVASGDFIKDSEAVDFKNASKYAGSDALSGTQVGNVNAAVSGSNQWGSAQLAEGTNELTVGGTTAAGLILDKATDGKFVASADGKTAANVNISGDSALTLLNGGTVGDVSGEASKETSLIVQGGENSTTAGDVTVHTFDIQNGAVTANDVITTEFKVGSAFTSAVNKDASGALFDVTTDVLTVGQNGSVKTGVLKIGSSSDDTVSSVQGDIIADNFDVETAASGKTNTVNVSNGATIVTKNLSIASGAVLNLGSDDENVIGSAFLDADDINLASGGTLIIDPAYGQQASLNVTKTMTSEGKMGIAQNSAFGVGFETKAELQQAISGYLDGNNSLSKDNVGAILYLNNSVSLGSSGQVMLDAAQTGEQIKAELDTATGVLFDMGANTALIIGEDVGYGPAISSTDNMTVKADESSKVIIEGSYTTKDQVNLFSAHDGNSSKNVTDNDFKAQIIAADGLLDGKYQTGGWVNFEKAKDFDAKLYNVSTPVKVLFNEAFDGNTGYGLGTDFILNTAAKDGGKAVESVARMAVYGGAVQATYMASQVNAEIIADRMNIANPNSNLVFADNAQGGGLWLAPVYKNHDSDSFDAQGVEYGADIDLTGVALGADFTTASGVRVGAMFNVGSGSADGQGVADAVSNDFDYYGMAVYAGMNIGQFALTADAGFTQVSNDMDQNSELGKLTADTDTSAVSVGFKGEYKFATDFVDITPHVGVRYTRLDMDSYTVNSERGVLASTDADSASVFSIPFGVTFAKDFAAGDWSVKPVLDLSVTANTGDTDFDTSTTFTGTGFNTGLSTEVLDDVTYGATLGISAKYSDSLSLGLNVNYTGSENADEFGVGGTVRYMF